MGQSPVKNRQSLIVDTSGKGLDLDAWGRPKAVLDYSIVHAMFTYNVPVTVWKEYINGVEQTSITNATSVDGKLKLVAGVTLNDETVLDTFRNPRYQPNRGHLYSSSIVLPSKTAAGRRDFGMFTEESGVFFRLKSDGKLYACRRTTVSSVTTTTEEEITGLPSGFDVEKGNIYDIQCQWRGVGNILFFVGNPRTGVTELVHKMNIIGTLDELSFFNPANPIAFCCKNLGANVELYCGCVDVSSEGGDSRGGTYGSVGVDTETGSVAISGYNVPVVAVRSKSTVSGLRNTRDTLALLATGYGDQRCVLRVWATRDNTAITVGTQSWSDFGDGHLEEIVYDPAAGTPMTFDTTKANLIFTARVNQDISYATSALFEGRTDIFHYPGDTFIFTMHRESGTAANVGVTYEFSEEI